MKPPENGRGGPVAEAAHTPKFQQSAIVKGAGTVAAIKARLSLRDSARLAGVELPERDGVKFRSPFRADKSPSCTIHDESLRDWSRGESLDAIGLFAAAQGISNAEAIRQLAHHLGITTGDSGALPPRPERQSPPPTPPRGPKFTATTPSDEGMAAILRTRKLPGDALHGLELAHNLGVLQFAEVGGFPCWLVTDHRELAAEARRLDGQPFPPVGDLGERKAHTLRGSVKSWPIGLGMKLSGANLAAVPVVLCEGGPDLLCAFALLATLGPDLPCVQPCAMLGTGATIGAEALALLRGRPCIIIAHGDEAGRKAADKWKDQLTAAACPVRVRHLPDGQDLNDLVSAHGLDAAREVIL